MAINEGNISSFHEPLPPVLTSMAIFHISTMQHKEREGAYASSDESLTSMVFRLWAKLPLKNEERGEPPPRTRASTALLLRMWPCRYIRLALSLLALREVSAMLNSFACPSGTSCNSTTDRSGRRVVGRNARQEAEPKKPGGDDEDAMRPKSASPVGG